MSKVLTYLESPQPELSFYHSADEAEQAYLNLTTNIHAGDSRTIGIDFAELDVPSSVHYSLRFRAHAVADTAKFFNHECE